MTTRVLFHDVGHGQAVHIFTPDGKAVVIDLGCSADFSPLEWLALSTKTIDLLIITHPHGDHIDEILMLDKLSFHVRQLWRPRWLTAQEVYDANQAAYKTKVDRYLKMSSVYTGEIPATEKILGNPKASGGVTIDTYASPECGTSNINNHSGVTVIKYASSTIIVPGDNEPSSWAELLKQPGFVSALKSADIFMASHHGRASGYSADLFADDRKPALVCISDGRVQDTDATARYSANATGWTVHNRSGFPSESRKAVTTRSDGRIDVTLGMNDTTPFLSVYKN